MGIQELVSIAKAAAQEAGNMLKTRRESLRSVNVQLAHDVKTQADIEAEAMIRGMLAPTGLPVIGEEGGGDEKLLHSDKLYWAVDPLDGTVNYVHGLPLSGVSIGLMRGLTPVAGVINDFWREDLFWGSKEMGVWKNSERLIAIPYENPESELASVLTATGLLNPADYKFQQLRNLGASTMHYVAILNGYLGGCIEEEANLWDLAAGAALLAGLGYRTKVEHLQGFDFRFEAYRVMA